MSLTTLRTFGRGGVHPEPHKRETATRAIENITPPSEVWLPLSQHIGEPATPIVAKGDVVKRGQKIAEGGATGVPIHATISGKVKPIDKRPHPTLVNALAIVIAASGEPDELEYVEDPNWRRVTRDEALARIQEAGIVGLGGAAFPTFRKLSLPPNAKVDTLVMNGADDGFVSHEAVDGFQKEMRDASADWQFVNFGGAKHCFAEPDEHGAVPGCEFHEPSYHRSMKMMRRFFAERFAK